MPFGYVLPHPNMGRNGHAPTTIPKLARADWWVGWWVSDAARRRSRSPGTTKSNPISIVSSPVVPTTQARDEVTPRVGSADHGALDEPRIQVTRTLRAVRQKLERRFYTPSASDSDDVHPEPEEEDALRKFFLLQHARAPQARAGPSQDESSEDDDDMLGESWHQYALQPQPAIQGVETTTAETQTDLVSSGTCANPSCEDAAEEACTAAAKCCAKCCLGRIAV